MGLFLQGAVSWQLGPHFGQDVEPGDGHLRLLQQLLQQTVAGDGERALLANDSHGVCTAAGAVYTPGPTADCQRGHCGSLRPGE
eukprot:scaffold20025_cov149-Isochrysis_galbana.AAC.7